MTGVSGYVVDISMPTTPSHGGDRGSKPLGTASLRRRNYREASIKALPFSRFRLNPGPPKGPFGKMTRDPRGRVDGGFETTVERLTGSDLSKGRPGRPRKRSV
jgi:hypothetical protein